jgi:germination protein M
MAAGIAVIILFITVLAVISLTNKNESNNAPRYPIYFFNPQTSRMESEDRNITSNDNDTIVQTMVSYLFDTPRNAVLQRVTPDMEDFYIGYGLNADDMSAEFYFTEEYYNLPPLDEALVRASVIWTVTSLPSVEEVKFTVDGEPLSLANVSNMPVSFNRTNVNINPTISWIRQNARTFALYFLNGEKTGLVKTERTVEDVDMDQIEKNIVQSLINGSDDPSMVSLIPADTKILQIMTEDGTCFIDLSVEFDTKFTGDENDAKLVLYSIVNTLADNVGSRVRRVRFMIDSDILEEFHGIPDFNQPFERDNSLLIVSENG